MAETATLEKPFKRVMEKTRQVAERQKECAERLSAKIDDLSAPIFVGLTAGSIILSLALFMRKSKENATFVGLWAPTLLALGLFHRLNRMRKQ